MSEITYNLDRIEQLFRKSLSQKSEDLIGRSGTASSRILNELNARMSEHSNDLESLIREAKDLEVGSSTEQLVVSEKSVYFSTYLFVSEYNCQKTVQDTVRENSGLSFDPKIDYIGVQCEMVDWEWKVQISKSSGNSYTLHHDASLTFRGDRKYLFDYSKTATYRYEDLANNEFNLHETFERFLIRRGFDSKHIRKEALSSISQLLSEVGVPSVRDEDIAALYSNGRKDSINHSQLIEFLIEKTGLGARGLQKIFLDDCIAGGSFINVGDLMSKRISFEEEVSATKIKNCYETDEDRERQALAEERLNEKKAKIIDMLKSNIDVDQTRIEIEELVEPIINNKSEIDHDARISLEHNPIDDFVENIISSYASSSRYFLNVGSPYVGYFLKANKTDKRTYEFKIYKSLKGHFAYAAELYMNLGNGLFRARDSIDEISYRQIVQYLAEGLNVDLPSLASFVAMQYNLTDFNASLEDYDDSIIYEWFEDRFEKMTLLELISKTCGLEEIEITNALDLVSSFTIDFNECFK